MRRAARSVVVAASLVGLAACGGDDGDGAAASAGDGITVFAAASLTESFTALGESFEQRHPGADVAFNFASSSDLVAQIVEGAPADVFASADAPTMQRLADAGGAAGEPAVFARNSLQIIVEAGNPEGITTLADLAAPDLVVVTCDPEVPIGRYAAEVLANAGVTVEPKSFEEDVKAVVNKVVLGEADAGLVYATDVIAAGGGAEGVAIPDEVNVTAEYLLAVTAEAPDPDGAAAFTEYVRSDAGQAILAEYGFSPASGPTS